MKIFLCLLGTLATVELGDCLHQDVKEGTTVKIRCPNKPVNSWSDTETSYVFTNKKEVNEEFVRRYNIDNNWNLVIHNFTKSDQRTYRCSTTRSFTPISFDITTRLLRRPTIQTNERMFNISTSIGVPVNISFLVDGYPKPRAFWTTDAWDIQGDWTVTKQPDTISTFYVMSTIMANDMNQLGTYEARIRNSEGSLDITFLLLFRDYKLSVKPFSSVCNRTQTVSIYCVLEDDREIDGHFTWDHYNSGVHIRRIPGEKNHNYSLLEISNCNYQDIGNYICSLSTTQQTTHVSSYLTVFGIPIILATEIKVQEDYIELVVNYISNPDIVEYLWFRNNTILKENNNISRIENKLTTVSAISYGKHLKSKGYVVSLFLQRSNTTNIFNFNCHLRNDFGSREYSFSHQIITDSILTYNVKKGSDMLNFSTFLYLYVPVGCVLVIVVIVFGGTVLKLRIQSKLNEDTDEFAAADIQENTGRNQSRTEEPVEWLDMDGYEEIDTASYHSVTWRDYSLDVHDVRCQDVGISDDNNDVIYLNVNSYEGLRDSVDNKHSYDQCQSSEV